MSRRVYISADYSPSDGDRDVVNVLHSWGKDDKRKVDSHVLGYRNGAPAGAHTGRR